MSHHACVYQGCICTFRRYGDLTKHIESGIHKDSTLRASGTTDLPECPQSPLASVFDGNPPPSPDPPSFGDPPPGVVWDTYKFHPFLTGNLNNFISFYGPLIIP